MSEIELQDVRNSAVRLLARREHSRLELQRKLAQRDFNTSLIHQVLDELEVEGLQSDQRYAESLVNSRIGRGQGPLKIRAELSQNGVPDNVVALAMTEASADWITLASNARRKRFGHSLPADYAEKARQARFLSTRGFASDTIWQVLGDDG